MCIYNYLTAYSIHHGSTLLSQMEKELLACTNDSEFSLNYFLPDKEQKFLVQFQPLVGLFPLFCSHRGESHSIPCQKSLIPMGTTSRKSSFLNIITDSAIAFKQNLQIRGIILSCFLSKPAY